MVAGLVNWHSAFRKCDEEVTVKYLYLCICVFVFELVFQ